MFKRVVIRWIILSATLFFIASSSGGGIEVRSGWAALFAVVVLSLANALVRPFLFVFKIVTWPVNLLTLGMVSLVASLVVNILVFFGIGQMEAVSGFKVNSFMAACFGALTMSLVNSVASLVVGGKKD